MWFDYGRAEGFPTQYPAMKWPVTADVLEAGLIFSFVLLAASFLVVLPGRRGMKFVSLGSRVLVSLFLGLAILLGNFGQDWEVGHVHSKTPYRVGTGAEIEADIGIKIGFRSVNVTLKSDTNNTVFQNETINYNERFEWTWDQGRFGFGPFAGLLQREFRAAQYKGLPLPIIWVVDYFVFDGEGLRFGRFYRTAGWYCHILLWVAFACWILANVFYTSVIRYGNFFLGVSGALQLFACLMWAVIRNPNPLQIWFEDKAITTMYGPSFYLTLVSGIISIVLSVTLTVFDVFYGIATADFFNVDPLTDYDELHISPEEAKLLRPKNKKGNDMPMVDMEAGPSKSTFDTEPEDIVILQRRKTIHFKNSRQYKQSLIQEVPIYSNDLNDDDFNPSEEYSNVPILPPRQGLPKLPPKRR